MRPICSRVGCLHLLRIAFLCWGSGARTLSKINGMICDRRFPFELSCLHWYIFTLELLDAQTLDVTSISLHMFVFWA